VVGRCGGQGGEPNGAEVTDDFPDHRISVAGWVGVPAETQRLSVRPEKEDEEEGAVVVLTIGLVAAMAAPAAADRPSPSNPPDAFCDRNPDYPKCQ
jgi:hypothetical protein